MKSYKNAFELITNDKSEIALLTERSRLMNAITDNVAALGLTQKEAAKIMKVTQPRVSDLFSGKISKFSLGRLFLMNFRINGDKQ